MFCKGFLSFQGSMWEWFEPGEHNTICKLTKPPISNCTHICSPATVLWGHLGHRTWTMEGIWGIIEFGLWKLGKPFSPSDHWFTEWSTGLFIEFESLFLCQDQTLLDLSRYHLLANWAGYLNCSSFVMNEGMHRLCHSKGNRHAYIQKVKMSADFAFQSNIFCGKSA